MLIDILSGNAFFGEFIFLLLCMGAAWMTGRSIAKDWKPLWNLVGAVLLLGAGARFLHFALYEAHFISLSRYLTDTLVLAVVAWLSYQLTRTRQMTQQYHWLYLKTSALGWKAKS